MSENRDPLRPKSRLPFAPTIKPSLIGAQGAGVWLYVIVAVAMGGLAIWWMRKNDAPITEPRVLLLFGAAVWFSVRAVMIFASRRGASIEDKNESQEGKDS